MLENIQAQLQSILTEAIRKNYLPAEIPSVEIETPADKKHGDFSSNIALKSAKVFRKPPMAIAQEISGAFMAVLENSPLKGRIEKVEVLAPGFINFYLKSNALFDIIGDVLEKKEKYGCADAGGGRKIQIEFVSANPTGSLSVAHARQAAVGDALGNVLKALGFDVTKEYYVNDGGNQINILGNSIKLRALENLHEKIDFPENGYQGEYIKDMANIFMQQKGISTVQEVKDIPVSEFSRFGSEYLLDDIKDDLKEFGVHFDVWSHESKIATQEAIKDVLALLDKKGHLYKHEGALWFKSTAFGDDKDRVVQKSDGSYTYLTPDIAYHKNKFERKFEKVINIWGPDHHGYIPRIKAAAQALGKDKDAVEVLIVQLATIYRNGQPVSMSTRRGQFISLREVRQEVGCDAARFFFLMRHIQMHLEFDLDLAKKQSAENPVYYIQYAHARVYSINEKAQGIGIKPKEKDFTLLIAPEEKDLIKKLGNYPQALLMCLDQLDPYPLVGYMQELAISFHRYYDLCRIVDPEARELSSERLGLVNAARVVLSNGLKLLGLGTPEKM